MHTLYIFLSLLKTAYNLSVLTNWTLKESFKIVYDVCFAFS